MGQQEKQGRGAGGKHTSCAGVHPARCSHSAGSCAVRASGAPCIACVRSAEGARWRPVRATHRAGEDMVTHSSAAEGCTPTQESNCALVALHLSATPRPWMISAASGPTCRRHRGGVGQGVCVYVWWGGGGGQASRVAALCSVQRRKLHSQQRSRGNDALPPAPAATRGRRGRAAWQGRGRKRGEGEGGVGGADSPCGSPPPARSARAQSSS